MMMKKIEVRQTAITPRICKSALVAGALLLASAGMICTIVRPLRAQDPGAASTDTNNKISLTFNHTPIKSALKILFGSEGINYSTDQDVQGEVTVDIINVTFNTALHAVLRSANPQLTYNFIGPIFHLKVKQDATTSIGPSTNSTHLNAPTGDQSDTLSKVPVDRYDAS